MARRWATAGWVTVALYSLATFWNSTRLSPSAVMPACAKPRIWPKRLTDR